MGNTWISDMRHYLDPHGGILAMPTRVQRLVDHFGAIVIAICAAPVEALVSSAVPCRRRPRRRPCPGTIRGFIGEDDGRIHWACAECEDNGAIAGWQGSPWDARRTGPLH
jgi:hypothetical protein